MSEPIKCLSESKPYKATPVRISPLEDYIRYFLLNHGCIIESMKNNEEKLIYPDNTLRQELYPRTNDIRYKVTLPDGAELLEIDGRGHNSLIHVYVIVDERAQKDLDYYRAIVASRNSMK